MTPLEIKKPEVKPTSRFTSVLRTFFVSVLSACGGGDNGIACATEARASVVLTVVDPFNMPLPGVNVTYQVNGGAAQTQTCETTEPPLLPAK
jgi:hypothetical protein